MGKHSIDTTLLGFFVPKKLKKLVEQIARRKRVTVTELCIGWLLEGIQNQGTDSEKKLGALLAKEEREKWIIKI